MTNEENIDRFLENFDTKAFNLSPEKKEKVVEQQEEIERNKEQLKGALGWVFKDVLWTSIRKAEANIKTICEGEMMKKSKKTAQNNPNKEGGLKPAPLLSVNKEGH